MDKFNDEADEQDIENNKLQSLGSSAPPKSKNNKQSPLSIVLDPSVTNEYLNRIRLTLSAATTRREILEQEVSGLAECLGLAMEIYKEHPFPEFAMPVTSLTGAHNSALAQLERMKDPKELVSQIDSLIKVMFTSIIKSLVGEIDKAKKEFIKLHPEDKITIEDTFKRMMDSVQPETITIYQNLEDSLKNILGIKK